MKVYSLPENVDQISLDDFLFFKIEASSSISNNIILRGKTENFCVGDECYTDNMKGKI